MKHWKYKSLMYFVHCEELKWECQGDAGPTVRESDWE